MILAPTHIFHFFNFLAVLAKKLDIINKIIEFQHLNMSFFVIFFPGRFDTSVSMILLFVPVITPWAFLLLPGRGPGIEYSRSWIATSLKSIRILHRVMNYH